MIFTVLTYNTEVWGTYSQSDLKSWDSSQIEKSDVQFCKRYLRASNKASKVACRAELDRFPLFIAINQKIINYSKSSKKDDFSSFKQIFITLAKVVIILKLQINRNFTTYLALMLRS